MQRAMQDHCSVFRSADVLEEGLRKMATVADALGDLAVADRSMIWNTDLVEALELDNLIGRRRSSSIPRSTAPKAAARMPARTIPERDDRNWLKHTLAWQNGDGGVRLGNRPVHLHTLSNEVQAFPPAERVY